MNKPQSLTDLQYSMRKRDEFPETMDAITPWEEIMAMIKPYYYENKRRRNRGALR